MPCMTQTAGYTAAQLILPSAEDDADVGRLSRRLTDTDVEKITATDTSYSVLPDFYADSPKTVLDKSRRGR